MAAAAATAPMSSITVVVLTFDLALVAGPIDIKLKLMAQAYPLCRVESRIELNNFNFERNPVYS